MLIVIFNGPPDSGKDTSADYLVEKHGFCKLEMKGALRKMAHAMATLNRGLEAVTYCDNLEFDKEAKDSFQSSVFGGRTWRQFLIWISEAVCKPIFGANIFALAAVQAIRDSGSKRVAFSDGGFQVEVDEIAKAFPRSIRIVHLYRSGCSFKRDPRGYVEAPPGEYLPIALDGDQGLVQAKLELDVLVSKWLAEVERETV